MMDRQLFSVRFVVMLVSLSAIHAFAPTGGLWVKTTQPSITTTTTTTPCWTTTTMTEPIVGIFGVRSTTTRMWMADDDDKDAKADEEDDDNVEHVTAELEKVTEEDKKPKEDPEVAELKKEIASLEATLKSKRNTLQYTKDTADDYSKAGYARKVAEMENMRRVRSSMNSSGRSSATANVLQEFLPLYDTMNDLKEKYAEDEFGSKYTGLTMKNTFTKMGVSEYTVNVGDVIDTYRMNVFDSEYSTEHAKNTVMKSVSVGMELDGNVIRQVDVMASLGEEVEDDEDDETASSDTAEEEKEEESTE